MFKQTLTRILQVQFIRQLLGAVAGALVALAVYTVYRGAHDTMRAYLLSSEEGQTTHSEEVTPADVFVHENEEEQHNAAPEREAPDNMSPPADVFDEVQAMESRRVSRNVARIGISSSAAAEVVHAGAPNLPSSGIGLWVAAFAALGASFASTRTLRTLLISVQSRVD